MLRIHYINPTGLFSYGYAANTYFEDGQLVNLVGVDEDKGACSNGAGKTSLFNALCEVLFGDNPTDISGPSVVNKVWNKGCCARVEFESWEGVLYRVTLCRDWKDSKYYSTDNDSQVAYSGTGLYLDRYVGTWQDCRGSGMPETRKKILELIGLSYSRFLSISYMSHRIGSKFLRGTNKDRVDILAGITGIEDWDTVLYNCREKKRSLEVTLRSVESNIAHAQGVLDERRNQHNTLAQTDWVTTIKGYQQALLEQHSRLSSLQEKTDAIDSDAKLLEIQSTELSNVAKIILEGIQVLERKKSGLTHVQGPEPALSLAEWVKVCEKTLSFKEGEYASLSHSDGKLLDFTECPTCGVTITKAQKDMIQKKIGFLNADLDKCRIDLQKAKDAVAADNAWIVAEKQRLVAENAERIAVLDHDISIRNLDYAENVKKVGDIQKQVQVLNVQKRTLLTEHVTLQREISNYEAWIGVAQGNQNALESLKGQIEIKSAELENLKSSISSVVADTVLLNWFVTNIPYIKLHKLSSSMSILSDLINSYLSDMGDTIRVDITAFSEKKTKSVGDFTDILKSEIQVEVKDGVKNIDPRLYSDGEIGKLSNAFVRSLRELALKSGKGCNILMLDEMFSFIDYSNSQKLAESFMDKCTGTTIVTDNSGKASDLMSFDRTWTARKRNGISTLEV